MSFDGKVEAISLIIIIIKTGRRFYHGRNGSSWMAQYMYKLGSIMTEYNFIFQPMMDLEVGIFREFQDCFNGSIAATWAITTVNSIHLSNIST